MNAPLRLLYRALLHLHPNSFRDRFGEEMLWIFDEQTRQSRSLPLLVDVLRSLLVQHVAAQLHPQPQPSSFYSEISSTPPLRRIAHATILSIAAVSILTHLFGPQGPEPKLSSSPLVSSSRIHNTFTYWHLNRIEVNPDYANLYRPRSEKSLSARSTQPGDPK